MKPLITYFTIALILSGCDMTSTKPTNTPVPVAQPPTKPQPVESLPSPSSEPIMMAQSVSCAHYQEQANQAVQAQDLVQLSQLFATLRGQPDCSAADVEQLKRDMSTLAAQKASDLVQRGNLDEAEK